MNLLQTLQPSTYTPDLSKARKVSFALKGEIEEEINESGVRVSYRRTLELIELREKKSAYKKKLSLWFKRRKYFQEQIRKARKRLNHAYELTDLKKLKVTAETLERNLKRLEEWNAEKPVFRD